MGTKAPSAPRRWPDTTLGPTTLGPRSGILTRKVREYRRVRRHRSVPANLTAGIL
jgi:hypothetical protein